MHSELYLYGLSHNYWSNTIQYGDASENTKNQVSAMMFEEQNGISPTEHTQLFISELEES